MKFNFNEDAWIHVTPLGEFEHAGAGVVQVIDLEALKEIMNDFTTKSSTENFPGLLVDFDHFSMDTDKSSEAAGWITALRADDAGLWAKVRWTTKGKEAVEGGEYRLVSPVFPKPSLCEDLGGGRLRPLSLTSVALTNDPNIKGAKPLTNRKHSLACAISDSPASECVCSCGGASHGSGNLDDIEDDDEGATAPKIKASSIRTNSVGNKFVSFTDEEGNQRYLREGDSEDGYEATAIDDQTGEVTIKTPSGETVQVKTDDIPKKKEVPAAVPPGKAKVPPAKLPPAKADPKKKLTGVQKWMLGELERKRKNEARKAAAKEKLKQIRDDLNSKRFNFNTKQVEPSAKSNGGVGKSFIGKAAVPKSRYYIDGAWYDSDGNFIRRNKPATSIRNRSGGEEKLYKWVLGETKSGNHCPECEERAGKVKTVAEWKAMGKPPCKCKCQLVPA
jgi:hypothetical protein